ncbi:mmgE/PrpD family protein [Asticcacaulis biprosthecium C19]|uniref:MmgE/PrpD family protein n=1 Tax=Asticcacaulis biprosthecium C19 TaxID=715226 RepID=F4QTJ8_9CAUL|nr:MmgE/PrpD family protein [Asticcacaulis biprosthecium]EGF90068.1 mmgE/PrpD family protein [Asticcacaulis biprosthecium C19]
MTLSDDICAHIAGAADIAEPARHATRRFLLDGVGVMLAASGLSPEARAFVAMAQGEGPCSILGHGAAAAPFAALANGAFGHALDFEDAYDAVPLHPNVSAIPAALAMIQAGEPVSGHDLITALTIGCDLVCRLGHSLTRPLEERSWYPPMLFGAIGASAVAARLAGLNATRTRDALSLMLCQLGAPGEIRHSRGTVLRAVREAFPAQAAVVSALLATQGVTGFEQPLEGEGGFFSLYAGGHYDAGPILDGMGQRWYGEALSFKPWPACRGTHTAIELALRLDLNPGDIASVQVMTGEVQHMLVEPLARKQAPATAIDAKFSLPFTVAAALVCGRVTLAEFDASSLRDPAILALAAKVTPLDRPDWGRDRATSGGLVVTLTDGRVLTAEEHQALGHPSRPLSDDDLVAKFTACAAMSARPLARDDAHRLARQILTLDDCRDAGAVFRV